MYFGEFSVTNHCTITNNCLLLANMQDTDLFQKFDVIYQTRERVFHRDIQTPRRELKIRRAAKYF